MLLKFHCNILVWKTVPFILIYMFSDNLLQDGHIIFQKNMLMI